MSLSEDPNKEYASHASPAVYTIVDVTARAMEVQPIHAPTHPNRMSYQFGSRNMITLRDRYVEQT